MLYVDRAMQDTWGDKKKIEIEPEPKKIDIMAEQILKNPAVLNYLFDDPKSVDILNDVLKGADRQTLEHKYGPPAVDKFVQIDIPKSQQRVNEAVTIGNSVLGVVAVVGAAPRLIEAFGGSGAVISTSTGAEVLSISGAATTGTATAANVVSMTSAAPGGSVGSGSQVAEAALVGATVLPLH